MPPSFKVNWFLMFQRTLVVAIVASLLTSITWSQEPASQELSELRTRLDLLEAQNQQLRDAIFSQTPPLPPKDQSNGGGDAGFVSTAPPPEGGAKTPDSSADEGSEVGKDLAMSANWNNGLELSTKDKAFRVHVGGRYQFDVGWFSAPDNVQNNINVPYADGADFRRARFRIDGTMYEVIDWAAEFDFINSARVRNANNTGGFDEAVTAPTDLWWTFTKLPVVGNLRIGNQKEGIGFEHLVSSRYQPFMERSYNQDTFYGGAFNGFVPGAQFFNTYGDEVGVWQLGIFKPSNSVFAFNTGNGDYSVTGRLTRLLWYEDDGRRLFHVGASLRQATAVGQNNYLGRQITFRTRDAIRTGLSVHWPTPANTGALFGDDMQWANLELAMVHGSWTMQAEWLVSGLQDARRAVNDPLGTNVVYHGGYVQLLYFLTGESDHYSRKTGFFERVTPFENYFFVNGEDGCNYFGTGAWQVGARYNYLDLNDQGINGGVLHNVSATLNWFLNPNMKVQFDYMATHRDAPLPAGAGDGWIHGWGMRFAHDF